MSVSASRQRPRFVAVSLVVVLALLSGASACSSSRSSTGPGSTTSASGPTVSSGSLGGHHNIVFILTDDMAMAELPYMPHARQLIGDQGATFDNYFVSNSLCCPSRTTTIRGQYSHNNGVLTNTESSNGGFETAHRLGVERHTIATSISAAGYHTALYGKYLNGYPHTAGRWSYEPPGWTEWIAPLA